MTQEQIVAGNKIIADFMGQSWVISQWQNGSYLATSHEPPDCETAIAYYSSLDWLHPVIIKIKNLDPEMFGKELYADFRMMQRQVTDMRICVDIDHAFAYVVEFLKWFNQNLRK